LHIVERERFRSAKEEAVDFPDGARQREGSKDMDKKCDGLELKGAEWRWRRYLQIRSPCGSRAFYRQAAALGKRDIFYRRHGKNIVFHEPL
jgi:hypothetical protein